MVRAKGKTRLDLLQGGRAITLGMAKVGLPDIVVDQFSWSLNRERYKIGVPLWLES